MKRPVFVTPAEWKRAKARRVKAQAKYGPMIERLEAEVKAGIRLLTAPQQELLEAFKKLVSDPLQNVREFRAAPAQRYNRGAPKR